MIRILFVGVWVLAVALGATYGGAAYHAQKAAEPKEPAPAKLQVVRVRPVTVPVIVGGVLKGYVSAELAFVREAVEKDKHGAAAAAAIDPESFIMDETFRVIYGENKVDFSHIEKVDLDALTKQIATRVNARLADSPVKEILIKGLAFIPKEDIPR